MTLHEFAGLTIVFLLGAACGGGTLLYLVRHGRLDAKKAADELADLANKAKRK